MGDGSYSGSTLLRSLSSRERLLLSESPTSLPTGSCLVTAQERDREAAWIVASGTRLGLGVDTISLAVAVLDRFLLATRVPVKYVNCVATTCLYLSMKLCEECVFVSDASRLISRLNLVYSIPELNRMELTILSRLNWDLGVPSVDRFFHAMLICLYAPFLPVFRHPLESVVTSSKLCFNYRPSLLALSLLSLLLESRTPYWFPVTVGFQRLLQIDEGELIACREAVADVLELEDKENVYASAVKSKKRSRRSKRKSNGKRSGTSKMQNALRSHQG